MLKSHVHGGVVSKLHCESNGIAYINKHKQKPDTESLLRGMITVRREDYRENRNKHTSSVTAVE